MSNRPRIMPVNFFDSANLTSNCTPALPVSNMQLPARDLVWRSSGLGQQIIYGDWGGNARQMSAWGIWPGLGVASPLGANVRVELYSDVARTNRVYDSARSTFSRSAAATGERSFGAARRGARTPSTARRGCVDSAMVRAVTVAAFKITITNGGAVDTPYLEARRFWLADYLEAPDFANFGSVERWMTNSQQVRTMGGSLRRASARALARALVQLRPAERRRPRDVGRHHLPVRAERRDRVFDAAGGSDARSSRATSR
jgi:hypothetical protein